MVIVRGGRASTFSLWRFSVTQAARSAMAALVPVSLKLILAFSPTQAIEHGAGVFERDDDAVDVDHFGDGWDRIPLIDDKHHRLDGSDLELLALVGQHQPPFEVPADDEPDEEAA